MKKDLILLDKKDYPDVEFHWHFIKGFDQDSAEKLVKWGEQVSKATGEKILIKLQAIYNIPDGGAEDKRMGEFLQELQEEVNE